MTSEGGKPRILLVEDDAPIRANVVDLLEAEGFEVVAAADGKRGLALAKETRPRLVVCDVAMPELDGFGLLRALRADPETAYVPFVFLTAKADRADVRTGMNLGADDYITKPFTRVELLDAIRMRLKRLDDLAHPRVDDVIPIRDAATPTSTAIVRAPAMRALYEEARRVAESAISVLVLGETGVGKDVLAREIHRRSPRARGPFVALNCAALTETLLESELFGHEKGAFTGAVREQPGLFESADGGTVFLDEIGELPKTIQVKLLRVLEDKTVMRVGGRTAREVDVRFVSATNADVESADGGFRQDLYFRLSGITLTIPPLRERKEEIAPLAARFVATACEQLGRRERPAVSAAALAALERYAWPGNVRELRNAIERAVVLCGGQGAIEVEHLPPRVVAAPPRPSSSETSSPARSPAPSLVSDSAPASTREYERLRAELAAADRQRVVDALNRCGGNQTEAAELLGISRRTLVSRLAEYAIPRPRKR